METNSAWGGGPLLTAAFSETGAVGFPADSTDNAIVTRLNDGGYTTVMKSSDATSGIGLSEIYDIDGPATSRLINLSVRGLAGTAQETLIAGFIIEGNTSERILVRAAGATLKSYGIANPVGNPTVKLFSGQAVIATSADWTKDAAVAAATAAVGAVPLQSATGDAALVATLPSGAYTIQVSTRTGQTGVALVELYEVP